MYTFAPLDRHYNNGFGAVTDSFRDVAEELFAGYHRVKNKTLLAVLRHNKTKGISAFRHTVCSPTPVKSV